MSGRRGIFRDRRAGGERVSIVPQKRKTRADPDPDWVMKNEPEDENPEFIGSSKVLAKSVVKSELLTRWEWLNDGDMWMVYASEHNIQINQALNTGKKTLKLSLGPSVSLQVDISKMIQINSKTGYQRQVRLAVKEQDQYFVWQWQSDEGYWVSYDANSCILLELALQADEKFVSLDLNGTHYTVDLGAMMQKNTQTQREREIQRCLSVAEDEEGEQLENVVEESITAKRPRRSVKIEEDSKEHVRTLLLKGKAPIDPECSSKIGKAHVFCEGDDVYDVMLNQTSAMAPRSNHKTSMNPEQLRQFIEIYRDLPCLWKTKSLDYSNKHKKEAAYEKLAEYCRTFYAQANVIYVKSKIANLRTVFKKEEHKLEASKRSGVGPDQLYVPKLWYYDLLSFVRDQDIQKESRATSEEDISDLQVICEPEDSYDSQEILCSEQEVMPSTSSPFPSDNLCKKRKRRGSSMAFDTEQLLQKLLDNRDDDCDVYGQNIARKLRRMTEEQRLAAEMLINEIVYKGLLRQLNTQNPRSIFAENSSNLVSTPNLAAGPTQLAFVQHANVPASQGFNYYSQENGCTYTNTS